MKILIAAQGPDLSSKIDKRFGHSKFFIIFDTETGDYESIPNAVEDDIRAGFDIIINENIGAVITGNIGPNSFERLKELGIPVYIVRGITAREALEKIASGELQPVEQPTLKRSVHEGHNFGRGIDEDLNHPHHGFGHGGGWGRGRGYGRGMGRGYGRGMGWGRGRGRGRGWGHVRDDD